MKKWINVELSKEKFDDFRRELQQAGIKYEPSSHGQLVHVEIYCSKDEETYLNAVLDELEG